MQDQRDNRREYTAAGLRRRDLAADPLDQFQRWLGEALDGGIADATAMALATADAQGRPSVRIVLLKHFDPAGLCWYTDYRSRKGHDLADNPMAAVLFHWRELSRQVRISGPVARLDAEDASNYFDSRPADSRFSAAASTQSAPIEGRDALEARVADLRHRHPDGAVPRPAEWGGYRLRPERYEFWQGREGRLHDRFEFLLEPGGGWLIQRLQP